MTSRRAKGQRGKTGNPGRHPLSQRGKDCYETPVEATLALLRHENLPQTIWEPAAGRGAIVNVLRCAQYTVVASDLEDYGVFGQGAGMDFLKQPKALGALGIVTNPPYSLATEFVRHALSLKVRVVAMLLRLAFLEGIGRSDILDNAGLARVYLFRNRLPRMHRDGWKGPRATSTIAFAWFVWERDHHGPAELHRITWEKGDAGGDKAVRRARHTKKRRVVGELPRRSKTKARPQVRHDSPVASRLASARDGR